MKTYRSKELVQAEQYFTGSNIECVKIGKSASGHHWSDRFDDTPDGPYVQGVEFKHRVKEGDWIVVYDNGDKQVFSNSQFLSNYELHT